MKKIEKKDNFLIFVTDTSPTCIYCKDTTKYINLYKEIYNLDMITYDKNKNDPKNFEKLKKAIQYTENQEKNWAIAPAIIIIKKGLWKTIVNENLYENNLKKYLIENKFIDEKEIDREQQLTDENMDEIQKQTAPTLAYIYDFTDKSYEVRKDLINLSKKYNFNYYLITYGFGPTAKITGTFAQQRKLSIPSLIVLENNKIIDITDKLTKNEIINFLKKNKIIF